MSSVGPEFTRNRGILFLALGILFFVIGVVVTWLTWSQAEVSILSNRSTGKTISEKENSFFFRLIHFQNHGGIYVAYVGAFLIALFLFARTLYYCTLSVSTIDGPM